jgi:hypothetical protein
MSKPFFTAGGRTMIAQTTPPHVRRDTLTRYRYRMRHHPEVVARLDAAHRGSETMTEGDYRNALQVAQLAWDLATGDA